MRRSGFRPRDADSTGGYDASAVGEDDIGTSVSTTWRTPAAGSASVWFVLRDSRGGIATQHRLVDVK